MNEKSFFSKFESVFRRIFGIKNGDESNENGKLIKECKELEVKALEEESKVYQIARYERETLHEFKINQEELRRKLKWPSATSFFRKN